MGTSEAALGLWGMGRGEEMSAQPSQIWQQTCYVTGLGVLGDLEERVEQGLRDNERAPVALGGVQVAWGSQVWI